MNIIGVRIFVCLIQFTKCDVFLRVLVVFWVKVHAEQKMRIVPNRVPIYSNKHRGAY